MELFDEIFRGLERLSGLEFVVLDRIGEKFSVAIAGWCSFAFAAFGFEPRETVAIDVSQGSSPGS